jgi:hypothetical protein
VAKTPRGNTLVRTVAPKPPTDCTLRPPSKKKSTFVVDDKKGAVEKEVEVDPDDAEKKLRLSTELDIK